MDYRVVYVKEESKACLIEYKEKKYIAHYDYYSGRVECYDGFSKFIFPDKPDGGMIGQAIKYKTFHEIYNSPEFMQAVTTEMKYSRRLNEREKDFYSSLILSWGKK